MSTAARKRVSFGSHKSMVETLIIDVCDDFIPSEERTFPSYHENSYCHLRHSMSSTAAELSSARIHQPHSCLTKRSHKRSGSAGGTIETDNPFTINGELRRKADFIIRYSRISRADLHIVDPDSFLRPGHTEEALPGDAGATLSLQEVPSTTDKRKGDTITESDRRPVPKGYASEVVDPTGTLNWFDQPTHVRETVTIHENRTLPDTNPTSQIQSKCDVVFTEAVCCRRSSPIIIVVDSVNVTTSPERQKALQVKLTTGKCCNLQ